MKTLILDTETSPNTAYVWGLFKQNVAISQLRETSRLLCACAKWHGKGKVHRISEWDAPPESREDFISTIWGLLDEADCVVTYNGIKFDTPVMNREFMMYGLPPPSPYFELDVYQTIKRRFRFASGKLDHVVQQLGLGKKKDTGGFQLWVDVMEGCPKAQKKMLSYCANDVVILEQLYDTILPWIKNHPNHGIIDPSVEGASHCPNCGGTHLEKRGFCYTKVNKYQRHVCKTCGTWSRERLSEKIDKTGVLTNI